MKELITLYELAELFSMTPQGISNRLRILNKKPLKKIINTLYFDKEVIKYLIEFKPKPRVIKKGELEIAKEVIYVTQTYHIYESKINFMV